MTEGDADHHPSRDVGRVVDLRVDAAERHHRRERIVARRSPLALCQQRRSAEGRRRVAAREARGERLTQVVRPRLGRTRADAAEEAAAPDAEAEEVVEAVAEVGERECHITSTTPR